MHRSQFKHTLLPLPHHSLARLAQLALTAALLAVSASAAAAAATPGQWGNYKQPFAADSLWNSRPLEPVFGTFAIPKSDYSPSIAGGAYSTGVFLAKSNDQPMQIHGAKQQPGVWDPDAEAMRDVTVPRWPADVLPASGTDGHADIADPVTGIMHSFWQLRQKDGRWSAAQYAWTKLDGRGWGDPAHYFQGARATGVPASAGLIRTDEANDGQALFHHALTMSLTFNALAAQPAYIFPATSADSDAARVNSGQIPQGALLMLPPSFDVASMPSPGLRKVAQTLKVYGAYVVDRNHGTPFTITVENGAEFKIQEGRGWNNQTAAALDAIRAALRQVVSQAGFIDANGKTFTPATSFNLLSMRGPWQDERGGEGAGEFDTLTQSVNFPRTTRRLVQVNSKSNGLSKVIWAVPPAGHTCTLTAKASNGAKLRLELIGPGGSVRFDSGELGNGNSKTLPCPGGEIGIKLYASSGIGGASSVRGVLLDNITRGR